MSLFFKNKGSTLISVLVLLTVLTAVSGSMIVMVAQEYVLSKRSLAWNQAVYTAESGIDTGWNEVNKLTAINTNGTFMSGWTSSGANTWSLSNQTLTALGGYESNSTYSVLVTTNSPQAGYITITASGTTTSPGIVISQTRNVTAILRPVYPFSMAILSKGLIDFNGNAAILDSFNSTTAAYSAGTRRAHGNIGTNGSLIDAAGLDLYGSAQTGPGGVVTTAPGFNMFQPGGSDSGTNTISDGLKVSIPDVTLPTGFSPSTTYGNVTSSTTVTGASGATTQYQMSSINLNGGGKTLTISGAGKVQIYVSGAIDIGGNAGIEIVPTAGLTLTVEFYVGGSINLDGNGLANTSQFAPSCYIYGLPTCTSFSINGTADLKAAVYVPNATATLAGGAYMEGALVASSINAVGTIDFHYDEALANQGRVTNYLLVSWREF